MMFDMKLAFRYLTFAPLKAEQNEHFVYYNEDSKQILNDIITHLPEEDHVFDDLSEYVADMQRDEEFDDSVLPIDVLMMLTEEEIEVPQSVPLLTY